MDNSSFQAIVLAAGKSTRMQSPKSKVLFRINGQPILQMSIQLAKSVTTTKPIVIIPPSSPAILRLCKRLSTRFFTDRLQTGNAKTFSLALNHTSPNVSRVLVFNADDSYLYSTGDIFRLLKTHTENRFSATILATYPKQRYPNIRKLAVNNKKFKGFLPPDQTGPISCGCYVIDIDWARKVLPKITPNPKNGEYEITSLFEIGAKNNQSIGVAFLDNPDHWWGINTKSELKVARKIWKKLNP